MTNVEYAAAFNKARRETAQLSLKAALEVNLAYKRASAAVSKTLLDAQQRGLSWITIGAQGELLAELQSHSALLSAEVGDVIAEATKKAASVAVVADRTYLAGVVAAVPHAQISPALIQGIYSRVNAKAVANAAVRMFGDGYTLSGRVWKLKGDYEEAIKQIVLTGVARGRDPVKIVRDLQSYTADGKLALANRWGGLERGTEEWRQRIHGRIDWRAQRLVRSEIQATVQSIAVQSGEANPAATGEYSWVLGPGLVHCAICSDNADKTFTAETIPEYPHPNCGCQVRPVLRDREQFVNDLSRWADGTVDDDNRYIDDWAQSYLQSA